MTSIMDSVVNRDGRVTAMVSLLYAMGKGESAEIALAGNGGTLGIHPEMNQTAACNRHHTLDQQFSRWLLRDRRQEGSAVRAITRRIRCVEGRDRRQGPRPQGEQDPAARAARDHGAGGRDGSDRLRNEPPAGWSFGRVVRQFPYHEWPRHPADAGQ